MRFETATDRLIEAFKSQRPLRAGSLIITVYGDAIAPRGGVAWLGSLIRVLEPFGLNGRLVRTSVFRLAKDGWLVSEQIGRRSYYGLTEEGKGRFEHATRRIYGEPLRQWDGTWTLAVLPSADSGQRDGLRKELGWLGFGVLAPGLMAHPAPDLDAVDAVFRTLKTDSTLLLRGEVVPGATGENLKNRIQEFWDLAQLEERFDRFLKLFRPVFRATTAARQLDPERCLAVRTLLIHEYRKILLRDPHLPAPLLSDKWPGNAAYQLCRNLYRLTHASAEDCLTTVLETADGPLPVPEAYFYSRFGGLH